MKPFFHKQMFICMKEMHVDEISYAIKRLKNCMHRKCINKCTYMLKTDLQKGTHFEC